MCLTAVKLKTFGWQTFAPNKNIITRPRLDQNNGMSLNNSLFKDIWQHWDHFCNITSCSSWFNKFSIESYKKGKTMSEENSLIDIYLPV